MKKRIIFRGVGDSTVLQQYAEQQLVKIEDFLKDERSPIYIDLICEPSKLREHSRVELRIKTPHYDLVTHYEFQGEAFYDVLDRVVDTMYLELREEKRKMVDKRKTVGRHDEFKKQR